MLEGNAKEAVGARPVSSAVAKMLRVEWLGQTTACICWIGSVFAYGVSSSGDWLQLCAATAWLVANIAAVTTDKAV
ncbi:hypothetical protein [Acanthopleuribacter pedis]|uniref:Uncharacterized protein n=1 Tax=Acanthopleuribacter pedis TaxID=442870 RepID=A0A8J7QUG1_9BACT|nr:hypothetical protein [Acanthopleuribacter pedis]MBO1323363.1 hypothetical protein [Acanthopleuribacter pedis]